MPTTRQTAIRRILCPVDFSDVSLHAFEQACAVARCYGAAVTVLHAYAPMFAPVPGLPPPAERVGEAEIERVRTDMASRCRAVAADIAVDPLVQLGQPTREILDCASRLPADLIVMGTHGASGFEHLVLGSVTEKVLRKAPCPVLTVPPRSRTTSRWPLARVVCAVDFSDWSLAALDRAVSLARETGGSLVLVHVIEWPWQEPPGPAFDEIPHEQSAALSEYRRYLEDRAAARLRSLVPEEVRAVTSCRVRHGKAHAQVLAAADAEHADMIVLGVHSRSRVDIGLLGSTANQVVRSASCPVLTVRA